MKKLVLVITTIALVMTMAFGVSAKATIKVSKITSTTTKVKVTFPKKAKYKLLVKVNGKTEYKKKTKKKVKKVTIKIKKQKSGARVVFKATNLKTKKSYKKTVKVVGVAQKTSTSSTPKKVYNKDSKLNKLLEKYGTLNAPEVQQMIQDDLEKVRATGTSIERRAETGWYDYTVTTWGISIAKDVKYSFNVIENGGMIGYYENYYETDKTLNNGQFIYALSNIKIPINIPKGCKVYLNIKGHIDSKSYINTEDYLKYYDNQELYKYPTKDNYDVYLTNTDKYINDIGRYCEAREGCSTDNYFKVAIYRYVICATVYDADNNIVAYLTEYH